MPKRIREDDEENLPAIADLVSSDQSSNPDSTSAEFFEKKAITAKKHKLNPATNNQTIMIDLNKRHYKTEQLCVTNVTENKDVSVILTGCIVIIRCTWEDVDDNRQQSYATIVEFVSPTVA